MSKPLLIGGGVIGLLALGGFGWSVFGTLKSEVSGVGLIIRGERLFTVTSKQAGLVGEEFVILDQQVKKRSKAFFA